MTLTASLDHSSSLFLTWPQHCVLCHQSICILSDSLWMHVKVHLFMDLSKSNLMNPKFTGIIYKDTGDSKAVRSQSKPFTASHSPLTVWLPDSYRERGHHCVLTRLDRVGTAPGLLQLVYLKVARPVSSPGEIGMYQSLTPTLSYMFWPTPGYLPFLENFSSYLVNIIHTISIIFLASIFRITLESHNQGLYQFLYLCSNLKMVIFPLGKPIHPRH